MSTLADDDATRPNYHAQALSRGMGILRAIASSAEASTVAHLHEATGYPKSTLVRLIAVLEDDDLVLRADDRPAYQLGHGMLPLATAYLERASVADVLRPYLTELAATTGWTANFGVLDGTEVVHLCVVFPDRPIYYSTTEGSSHPAYRTGLGKAILSGLDDDDAQSALPAEPYLPLTPHTITTWERMRENLRQSRERGYAVDEEESDLGLRCLAVPILTSDKVTAAVSVSGPTGEVTPEREATVVTLLRETAERVRPLPAVPSTHLARRRTR